MPANTHRYPTSKDSVIQAANEQTSSSSRYLASLANLRKTFTKTWKLYYTCSNSPENCPSKISCVKGTRGERGWRKKRGGIKKKRKNYRSLCIKAHVHTCEIVTSKLGSVIADFPYRAPLTDVSEYFCACARATRPDMHFDERTFPRKMHRRSTELLRGFRDEENFLNVEIKVYFDDLLFRSVELRLIIIRDYTKMLRQLRTNFFSNKVILFIAINFSILIRMITFSWCV